MAVTSVPSSGSCRLPAGEPRIAVARPPAIPRSTTPSPPGADPLSSMEAKETERGLKSPAMKSRHGMSSPAKIRARRAEQKRAQGRTGWRKQDWQREKNQPGEDLFPICKAMPRPRGRTRRSQNHDRISIRLAPIEALRAHFRREHHERENGWIPKPKVSWARKGLHARPQSQVGQPLRNVEYAVQHLGETHPSMAPPTASSGVARVCTARQRTDGRQETE